MRVLHSGSIGGHGLVWVHSNRMEARERHWVERTMSVSMNMAVETVLMDGRRDGGSNRHGEIVGLVGRGYSPDRGFFNNRIIDWDVLEMAKERESEHKKGTRRERMKRGERERERSENKKKRMQESTYMDLKRGYLSGSVCSCSRMYAKPKK